MKWFGMLVSSTVQPRLDSKVCTHKWRSMLTSSSVQPWLDDKCNRLPVFMYPFPEETEYRFACLGKLFAAGCKCWGECFCSRPDFSPFSWHCPTFEVGIATYSVWEAVPVRLFPSCGRDGLHKKKGNCPEDSLFFRAAPLVDNSSIWGLFLRCKLYLKLVELFLVNA